MKVKPTQATSTLTMTGQEPSARRRALLVVILAVGAFTWGLNFSQLVALLKLIALDFGVSDAAVGQLATLHAVATGATALVITPWMDRFGRGRLLRIGAGLLMAGTACSALAPGFAWLFPARLLAGIGAAFIMPVCFAAAADLFQDPRKRSQAVGLVIAATALAGIIGLPILTQIGDAVGWRWATASILAPIAVMLAGSWGLPSRAQAGGRAFTPREYLRHYRSLLSNRQTDWLLVSNFTRGIAWYGTLVYLGAYAITVYGFDANRLSLLFVTMGVVFFVATNVMPLVARVISTRRLYVVSTVILFANYLSAGLIAEHWGMFVFVIVLAIAGGGVNVAESVLLLDSFPAARGGVMSLRSASVEMSTALGAATIALLLVLTDSYAVAYRLLALPLPFAMLAFTLSVRQPRAAPAPSGTDALPASAPEKHAV